MLFLLNQMFQQSLKITILTIIGKQEQLCLGIIFPKTSSISFFLVSYPPLFPGESASNMITTFPPSAHLAFIVGITFTRFL